MVSYIVKKLLKDPFVHFILLGFLAFVIVDEGFVFQSEAKPQIVITDSVENLIALKFSSNQGRQPNESELKLLTEQYVREEVLVREAIKLGLDENDHVIRARLVELVDSIGLANNEISDPTDEELKRFAQDSAARYSVGGRFSLEQIYLGKEPDKEFILSIQKTIASGTPVSSLGVNSNFTFRFNNASKEAVISLFGGHFFELLMEAELGQWSQPISSPAGLHLVRVLERAEPTLPPVDNIRHRLVSDWRSFQKRQLLDKIYKGYRSDYEVLNANSGAE